MQTEASVYHPHFGCIPSSWMVVDAIEACSKITDGTHDTPKAVPDGQPYIKSVHIKNGEVDFDNCLFVSEADHETIFRRCNPEKGDLLVVNIGAGNIGDCAYVTVDFEFSMKNIALLKPKKDTLNSLYFYYYYRSRQERITHTAKTGGAQPFLSLKDLKKLKVVLPPINEQCKIARILLTWDKAISTIERLIDNSKQQKKALMQQLLTGKKRLLDDSGKPFEGEWVWSNLDTVCDVKGGKRLPKGNSLTEIPNNHPYIRVADMYMGGVDTTNILYVPLDIVSSIKNYTIAKDDLFITVAGTLGIVGEVPAILDGANLTENADKLTNISCNKKFLLYVLKSPIIQRYVDAESTQNAQPKLALTRIRSFKIPLPSSEEQQRIATVLTNPDKEIELLEQQLADLKQEKKALMQQLLTGKRRVKIDDKESA